MELDHDRAERKRDELVATISVAALQYDGATGAGVVAVASEIVSAACTITSPGSSGGFLEYITLSEGGRGGGSSVKPGNVTLNFKKLFNTIAAGGLTLTGVATAPPWVLAMMGLVLWDSLWSHLKADIQEREATVLWAFWINRSDGNLVAKSSALGCVNAERNAYGRAPLSQQEFDDGTELLAKMGCIDTAADAPHQWWIREWVRVTFR